MRLSLRKIDTSCRRSKKDRELIGRKGLLSTTESATRRLKANIRWASTGSINRTCSGTPIGLNRRRVIRKRLLLYTIVAALAVVFIQTPHNAMSQIEPSQHLNNAETQELKSIAKADEVKVPEPEPTEDQVAVEAPEPQPQAKAAVATTVSTPVAAAKTCEEGIRRVWPAHLQDGAILVSKYENRRQDPEAVGAVNPDAVGSRDYGCFQINNYWHSKYFTDGDWRDPEWAAEYALRIYREREARDGNGWRAWYAVQGVLW